MAISGGPDVSENGLVLYLDAGNIRSYSGSGTTWTDVSGNGNVGTLTNGPTFSSEVRGNIVFDGVDDNIVLPTNSLTTASTLTIEAWVNLSLRGDRHIIVCNWTGWAMEVGQSGNLLYPYFTWWDGTQQPATTWNLSITPNTWNHIACTFDGSVGRVYVNGALSAVSSNTTISYGVYARQISGTTFSGPILGNVSMVRNYNVALTAQQILQNYNALRSRFGL
jgi:hypothetical protein